MLSEIESAWNTTLFSESQHTNIKY